MTPRPTKIINDPVHGFIEIPKGILLQLIDSEPFQRLRHIRQLGLSSEVYPGAVHTRFHHALGAMHLMTQALDVLRRKGVEISAEEYEAAQIAILLHDIGHGPFSHALEHEIIRNLHHEDMSAALMHHLNREFSGKLSLAIEIFEGNHPKEFLHQLVSSQLDMDRMDYLMRDSFFTGVVEGIVGADRIIKTLNVYQNRLVVEEKGIYSVEKFIVARRLMYWQVYLHKAAVSSENMLVKILKRARILYERGEKLFMSDALAYFFANSIQKDQLNQEVLNHYIQLDDHDIFFSIKQWQHAEDRVLSELCYRVMHRQLFKTKLQDQPISDEVYLKAKADFCAETGFSDEEADYFVFRGSVSNQAYNSGSEISIWFKAGEQKDLASASDMQNIQALARVVEKHYLSLPF